MAPPAAAGVCYDSVTRLRVYTRMAALLPANPTVPVVISPLTTLVALADKYNITASVPAHPLHFVAVQRSTQRVLLFNKLHVWPERAEMVVYTLSYTYSSAHLPAVRMATIGKSSAASEGVTLRASKPFTSPTFTSRCDATGVDPIQDLLTADNICMCVRVKCSRQGPIEHQFCWSCN